MKSKILIIIFILVSVFCFNFNYNYVYAVEDNLNTDEIICDIIEGISEDDFNEIVETINNLFNSGYTFKELLILFIKGEIDIDFTSIKNILISSFKSTFLNVGKLLGALIFLIILQYVANIIISKNNQNIEKNTIFYICYSVYVIILVKLASSVFSYATSSIEKVVKLNNVVFPVMFSISGLVGNFGVSLCKPLTVFISFFGSSIISNFFMPILSLSLTSVLISNLSDDIKLDSLNKNLLSLLKWILGVLTVLFTCFVTVSGIVNAQYNGASVKVLKYATGSLIPIVGGFLSGGVDVFLTSAILLKNSLGIMAVVYLMISVFGSGVLILILSFLIKLVISICEPIADKKFVSAIMGVTDVFNYLAGLVFISGFMCFLTIICLITSTATVI